MCFRPIRLSNIRLHIGIMLSRLIIYHDNLADWTFSLLSHMLMSNNSLTCTSQQKVDTTLYFYTSFNEHNTPYTVLESDNSESMPDVLH
jgi:hypothetical protein